MQIQNNLLGSFQNTMPAFLETDYYNNAALYDRLIDKKYSDYEILIHQKKPLKDYSAQDVREFLTEFQNDFYAFASYNSYKWQNMYETTQYDYDPIENYNMVEDGIDNRTLANSNTNTFGEVNTTNSNVFGENKSTSKSSSVPFDVGTEYETDKVESTNNSHTDTMTSKRNAVTDSTSSSGTDNNLHHLTRSGNIGVTTSQQMIEAQRNVIDINVFDLLFKSFLDFECSNYLSPEFTYW